MMGAIPAPLRHVIDDARWAPSGDNEQPWRFEVLGPRELLVHGHDTRHHCVYDLRGEASLLALGALLETIQIAATKHGWSTSATLRPLLQPEHPIFEIHFEPYSAPVNPLAEFVRRRAVQRRPMSTRPLTQSEKQELECSVRPGFSVRWFEGVRGRWDCAALMFHNARLRLTMPEGYAVHSKVIEWGAEYSVDRVPDRALGVDSLSLAFMKMAMKSWKRVHFANRYLAGTWLPRLQMELIPGLACGAHAVIVRQHPAEQPSDFIDAGRAVQRFWLTATRLSLWQQPEMTPLIFSRYFRQGTQFSKVARCQAQAATIDANLRQLLGENADHAVWMGRLGKGPAPQARSTRRPLADLVIGQTSVD